MIYHLYELKQMKLYLNRSLAMSYTSQEII